MAKELPFFRFTVSEWLNDDISLESYHLQGVFASVCAFYWFQDCSITKAKLKKRFSDAQADIEALVDIGVIKEAENDFVSIKFLDDQYDLLSEKRKKRVEAGRKGGLASSKQRASNAQAKVKQSSSYKDKDNNKDNDKDNTSLTTDVDEVPNASDVETWESSKRVAEYLLDAICESDTTHKYTRNPPSLNGWVKEIDRAIRLDGRKEEEFIFIIDAVFRKCNQFSELWHNWHMNIESGKKLRDQFDKIKNQIIASRNGNPKKPTKGDLHAQALRSL